MGPRTPTCPGELAFGGHPADTPDQHTANRDAIMSAKVVAGYLDGRLLTGMTFRFPPNQPFFFIVPVDPRSNNIRVLVNRSAVTQMKRLDEAPA
jgi:hypothetical protein